MLGFSLSTFIGEKLVILIESKSFLISENKTKKVLEIIKRGVLFFRIQILKEVRPLNVVLEN